MSATTIKRFRDNMENIIAKHGQFIQAVVSDEGSFAYTIGRTDKGAPEFYTSAFNSMYGSLLKTIPAAYDAGLIQVGVPFHHLSWVTEDERQKTWFVIDEVDAMQLDNMIGAVERSQRNGQTMVPPLEIIVANKRNELPGQFVLPEPEKVPGALTGAEARKLYEDNWPKEFTTMAALYDQIRTSAMNGAYSVEVFIDSATVYDEVKLELHKAGFDVSDYNGGKSSILEIEIP